MQLIQLKQLVDLAPRILDVSIPAVKGLQLVYQTGDQLVSGEKTFVGLTRASGGIHVGAKNLNQYDMIVSGNARFDQKVRVSGELACSGELWITGYDSDNDYGGVRIDQDRWFNLNQPYLTYTTGIQFITGAKIFNTSITGLANTFTSGDTYCTGDIYNPGPYTPKDPHKKVLPMLSGATYEDVILPIDYLPGADPLVEGVLYRYESGNASFLMISHGPPPP